MSFSPTFDRLVEALTCLPGVGPKTAQRMALELLLRKNTQATDLAKAINLAIQNVQRCHQCQNLSDREICLICDNELRDQSKICVVEAPSDVLAIEQSTDYQGLYFVLMGHIAPLDGIGPTELGMDKLESRLLDNQVQELILATNSTLEGETTAYFLNELAEKYQVKTTRLAHGVPIGGELAYIDKTTLQLAFKLRNKYDTDASD